VKLSVPVGTYRHRALIGTLTCLGLLAVLALAVLAGFTDSLDVWARERFRPDFTWGDDQQRANHVVFWLAPAHMRVLLLVGSAVVSAWRWTLWPLIQSGLAVSATAGTVLALKFLMDRADPKGGHTSLGGSFPSGHSAVLLVCVATGAMLVSCPTRWWQRAGFLVLEAALAAAMLYVGLHWLTDIVGGALVAGVVLGIEALVAGPDGGPSHGGRRHRFRRPSRSPARSLV
jgi:membrane-associated phospholipid phosphatase